MRPWRGARQPFEMEMLKKNCGQLRTQAQKRAKGWSSSSAPEHLKLESSQHCGLRSLIYTQTLRIVPLDT
jgi:hypothetical protein